MEIKTVSIIGLGALGILYGDEIMKNTPLGTVRCIASENRIKKYQSEGIYINGKKAEFEFAEPNSNIAPADLLIFAVKAPNLAEAIEDARSQIGENTTIISVLNGIHSEVELGKAYGTEKVLFCVAQGMDATKIGNQLKYGKSGLLKIGTDDGKETDRLLAVAAFLDKAGLNYVVLPDMHREIWSKFMLNCGINQASIVYNATYGDFHADEKPRQDMIAAMREVKQIAQKMGIDLSEDDIEYWIPIIESLAPEGRASMGQDLIARRKSEVDIFGGTISKLGREHGVPTPINDFFVQRIHEIESTY